ncbi:MAG TPA: hypothetical protein VFE06_17250 [Acidobacteriaceae bacterium]|jgi:hypothetical protein|nr:hypothetical protein [Acidobacteriaceae bacterium]
MNAASVEKIADAVLYEGYLLYPYRASSLKNRQRWNFGTLYPRSFAELPSSGESASFQSEVLVQGNARSRLSVRVRFLQLLPGKTDAGQGWNEGAIQTETVDRITLTDIAAGLDRTFTFPAPAPAEGFTTASPAQALIGALALHCVLLRDGIWRLRAVFSNETPASAHEPASAKSPQTRAFVSAHLLLEVEEGAFVSLLDPPVDLAADAAACMNRGVFPVLAGGDAAHMLVSPIILYDHPQIAPESAGDFFDGTEMDEMLALRVLTLTDEEKAEMREGDHRAAAILQRTETLPDEQFLKLHGAVRGLRPSTPEDSEVHGRIEAWNPFEDEKPPLESVRVFGVDLRCGDRVRLWPDKQADILDIAMKGKVAVIEAIEQDLEGNIQLAVVLEDDPGRDMGLLRQAGHRFFFRPEEIEPLRTEAS